MRKLLFYLKDYKKETVLGPLFKLLEATLELLVPLVVAAVIDTGIEYQDRGYIVRMCLVLAVLGVIGLVFSITAQFFAAKAAVGFVTKIRHALFSHIQSFSYAELDVQGTSTLITRMTSDMNQVQAGMNLTLRLLLRSPFVVIGAMIMAFTIDVKAALVFAVGIPVLAAVVFSIMLTCIPLYRKVQSRLDGVLGLTRENLTGVRVLRAFCKEEEQREVFQEQNQRLTDIQKFVGRISALLNPVTYVIINLAIIALVWIGAIRVDMGILSQGAVVALYNYMSQILTELIKLANLIINITKSVACGNRIQSVLEMRTSILDGKKEADWQEKESDAVVFENAALRYPKAAGEALSNLNFTVRCGETIGVIGGTGSGKTSLVNLIPRFYDCSHGKVLVNGLDVRDYPLKKLRAFIGVVPQRAVLFQGTIRENMKWGNTEASDGEILEALRTAQAMEIVEGKKEGLDFVIEQGGRNLSGGQRQRLTIARALVKKPEILILDDSSSALDFATDAALRRAIENLEEKPTLFLVSQRSAAIQSADKIIVLDDGKVAGIGRHEELLADCEVYREIYESQFQHGKKEVSA